ncbi:MAG: HD domain-containing protein [Chloroflexota bacterium]|nr:CCA tRNA nucleotidyltransferase [Dehalococcoidia bacterium]MDW8253310.1 HD domain-containing protein [Chloroflexota bacterium]
MESDELIDRLTAAFEAAGRRLYLVGGSVRDRLLGRPSPDLDFTTDAPPDEVQRIARTVRPDAIFGVGAKFGTIGLAFGERLVEITTFRSEVYQPRSRHPQVTFGTSLEGDLARRDFTINAMACRGVPQREEEVIDPFGGLADLRAGIIRAVGNPAERFDEDPLRMLRAVRLAAQLGFRIEQGTEQAIRRSAPALADISKERIGAEFTKILVAPHPAHGIRLCVELGLMVNIIPELLEMLQMPPVKGYKDVFRHTLLVVERIPPEPLLRWSALLHDIAKPRTMSWEHGAVHFRGHERVGEEMATEILRRLRLDADFIRAVAKVVRLHVRANSYSSDWTDSALRRFIREAGEELPALIALCRADVTSARPARVEAARARADELEARVAELMAREDVAKLDSPLDGNELMAIFGRGPGRWIGEVKRYLLELVLDGTLAPDDKTRAEELARAFLAERDPAAAGAPESVPS